MSLNEISSIYKVSKSTICLINTGKTWKDEKEKYPLKNFERGSKGDKNPRAKYTEEQVMEMRKKYSQGVSSKDIISEYAPIASEQSVRNILMGKTYSHLPYWSYSNKKWIYPTN